MTKSKELHNFLNNNNCDYFSFEFKKEDSNYTHSKNLAKVKMNDDYILVMDFNKRDLLSLEKMYISSYGTRNFEIEALYFPKINSLVYESSYNMPNFETNDNIHVYAKEQVLDEIYDKINHELKNRESYLIDAFKHERESIDDYKTCKKDFAVQVLIGTQQHEFSILSHGAFKEKQNRQMIYEYLQNPNDYIVQFVDNYLTNEDYLERIKNNVTHYVAVNELVNELKDDAYVLKAKRIFDLLNGDLKEAKNIWVIDNENQTTKVINRVYDKDYNRVTVGDWSTKVDIAEIHAIKYSRTIYEIA